MEDCAGPRAGAIIRGVPLFGRRRREIAAVATRPYGRPGMTRTVVRSGTPLELSELAWVAEGVSRESALSIPAVLACRNLVVGTVVQLRWFRYRGGDRLDPGWLLSRPDPATILPATLGGTVDDLLFRGRAYWLILQRDAEGFPMRCRWIPVADVTPQTTASGGTYSELLGYQIAGVAETVDPGDVIRFDSPLPGVLDVGGRTLANAVKLEDAAGRLASVELPAGTLTNTGAEMSADELRQLVADFQEARRETGVAVLQDVEYSRENLNAEDLGLVPGRDRVVSDVARLFNVPVAMIAGSPSGNASALLYSNLSQQQALLLASAVEPHLQTIEWTLSDSLPRGQSVAFDRQTFLRSDPAAAADYVLALLAAEVITVAEARSMFGIPSAPVAAPDLTPGSVGT